MAQQAGYIEKFIVGGKGETVVLQLVQGGLPAGGAELTKDEALTMAAWLVALVGDREGFDEILQAVEST